MRRNVALVGLALLVPGLGLFAWKTLVLGLPIAPSNPEGLWQVELEIRARGEGARGSVRAALPSSETGQILLGEAASSDRLTFSIRDEGEQRIGVWNGSFEGVHELTHSFRVRLKERAVRLPPRAPTSIPEPIRDAFGGPSRALPTEAPEIREFLAVLDRRGQEDGIARARTLFGFVADEVELARSASEDVLIVLADREGNADGKARLLATLLRANGTPARLVNGLRLRADRAAREATWVEAWLGTWAPMFPAHGSFGRRPAEFLALNRGGGPLVDGRGIEALSSSYQVRRERLRPDELESLMVPTGSLLTGLSLYRLPLPSQRVLRLILLIPLGVFLMAVLRNIVGVPAFGTFLPILIALALRGTNLAVGIVMLASVIVLGVLGRLFLDRLQLLLVPRLCLILCIVVLGVTGFALVGRGLENRELYGSVLFPIVILSMLIERFSITSAEEGLQAALIRLAWTASIVVVAYPVFHSALAEHLMFGYPELVLVVMGMLVWVGGYTGYRLAELIRFRSLAVPGSSAP